jgi:hypothetical protein
LEQLEGEAARGEGGRGAHRDELRRDAAPQSFPRKGRAHWRRRSQQWNGGSRRGREGAGEETRTEGHSAPDQPTAKEFLAAVEPSPECTEAPTQLAGGFVLRALFEEARDQRRPKLLRQRREFFIEHAKEVVEFTLRRAGCASPLLLAQHIGVFAPLAPLLVPSGREADAPGHPKEPPAHGSCRKRAPRVAGQHEEDRLEGVFGQVRVTNRPLADSEDKPAVPLHQLLEGGLIAFLGEARHERAVVQRGERVRESNAKGHHGLAAGGLPLSCPFAT